MKEKPVKKTKYSNLIISSIISILFISCATKDELKSITIGNGNDVVATLKISNKTDIFKIEFYSQKDTSIIGKKEILNNDRFIYNFKNPGEGLLKVCIYKLKDTICSENYVEGGYQPEVLFMNDSIIFYSSSVGEY